MAISTEDFLAHYGVKGMKWGVRKKRKSGTGAAKPVSRGSSRGKKPGTRTYDVKKLSNKDLKRVTERMRLEQEYARLNTQKKATGSNFVTNFLKKEGGKLVKSQVAPAIAGLGIGAGVAYAMRDIDYKSPWTK